MSYRDNSHGYKKAENIENEIIKHENPAQNEPEKISILEHQNEIKPPSSLDTQNQGNNQKGLNQAQGQNPNLNNLIENVQNNNGNLNTSGDLATKLNNFSEQLGEMKKDMSEMKKDMSEMKKDMSEMKGNISEMKKDMSEMKKDMSEMKGDISEMKGDISEMKEELKGINANITSVWTSAKSGMWKGFSLIVALLVLLLGAIIYQTTILNEIKNSRLVKSN